MHTSLYLIFHVWWKKSKGLFTVWHSPAARSVAPKWNCCWISVRFTPVSGRSLCRSLPFSSEIYIKTWAVFFFIQPSNQRSQTTVRQEKMLWKRTERHSLCSVRTVQCDFWLLSLICHVCCCWIAMLQVIGHKFSSDCLALSQNVGLDGGFNRVQEMNNHPATLWYEGFWLFRPACF